MCSKKTRRKISKTLKKRFREHPESHSCGMLNKHHSKKTKTLMSKNRCGKNNSFYGHRHTERINEINSEKHKGTNNPNYGRGCHSTLSGDFHFYNTLPERVMKRHYIKCGIKYKFQYFIKGGGSVDFFLPRTNTVVFIDGCYWHGCPTCDKGIKRSWRRKKDALVTKRFLKMGYNVERVWEHEIRKKYSISWREEKYIIMVNNKNVGQLLKRAA